MPHGSSDPVRADHVLEVQGLFCPIPIARATERMVSVRAGEVLEIRSTDPGVIIDVPAWCYSAGHDFLGCRRAEALITCWVRKKAAAAP